MGPGLYSPSNHHRQWGDGEKCHHGAGQPRREWGNHLGLRMPQGLAPSHPCPALPRLPPPPVLDTASMWPHVVSVIMSFCFPGFRRQANSRLARQQVAVVGHDHTRRIVTTAVDQGLRRGRGLHTTCHCDPKLQNGCRNPGKKQPD